MFDAVPPSPEDALHAVMGRYSADIRTDKIDLGVGVYREADGASPIMACVSDAQARWLSIEDSKSYLGLQGNERFLAGMAELVFGVALPATAASIQTIGGTGGVRLGLELARSATPSLSVHVGVPTWPNHLGICGQLNLSCETWPYFDSNTQRVDLDQAQAAIDKARPGDVVILHGPCHNPTGADLAQSEFLGLIDSAVNRGLVPLLDVAYYGLGNDLRADLQFLRECLARAPEMLLVLSCSKAFGLYRERVGVLFAMCSTPQDAKRVQGRLEFMARGNYSMPPSHGAATVAEILADDSLTSSWRSELERMRDRVLGIRRELHVAAKSVSALAAIGDQKGIFSMLPLTPAQVAALAKEHAIYMPSSGRINIAGLKTGDVERLVHALSHVSGLSA